MLFWRVLPSARVGLALCVVSGLALVVVALSPEDVARPTHGIAAICSIVGGAVAMLLAGLALAGTAEHHLFGRVGAVAGVRSLVAAVLLTT